MKMLKPISGFLIVSFISLLACHKPVEGGAGGGTSSTSGDPIMPPAREYFWSQQWSPTSRGDELNIRIPGLVDSVINKGINIGLAVYSDWDIFQVLPFDYYDENKRDTVRFMYEVIPGQLTIIAKAAFKMTYPSDVFIQYK